MPDCIAEIRPRPRERVVVTLTGGRSFTIPEARAHPLSVGLELSDSDIGRLDRIDQYFRGREKALRMISLRARTRAQVRTALDNLEISVPVRDGIIGEFEENGLIDDERFAREFVQVKAEVRLMGPHRLRRDLAKLGIKRDIVDTAIGEELGGERKDCLHGVRRKIGGRREAEGGQVPDGGSRQVPRLALQLHVFA